MRRHLTYANVVSTLCLFLVLGGGITYAANTIGSGDVIDDSLRSRDIKNRQVKSKDLKPNAVNGRIVADNAITGDDVDESTLQGVLGEQGPKGDTGATGPQGVAGPSTGPAGGDLTGTYPNPLIAADAVDGAKVENDSLTAHDIAGGESNGAITLNSGFVATGRCRDVGISVPGAEPGDAVLFSVNSDLPDGILLSGVRVIDDDVIQGKACNFTGGVFPQLDNIQVAIVTISI